MFAAYAVIEEILYIYLLRVGGKPSNMKCLLSRVHL